MYDVINRGKCDTARASGRDDSQYTHSTNTSMYVPYHTETRWKRAGVYFLRATIASAGSDYEEELYQVLSVR